MTARIFGGSTRDARTLSRRLKIAATEFNLVSPSTSVGHLPEGWEITFEFVRVSPAPAKGDVYLGEDGELVLSSAALKRIAKAAGISWDGKKSQRTPSNHPYVSGYHAVATVRAFDATPLEVTGEVEIDLRHDSPQMRALADRKDFTDLQLRDRRRWVVRDAETQAKLRAIAELGVKRSYSQTELRRGFAVAKLIWTGRTKDPALRRELALRQQDARVVGERTLFGKTA